MEQKGCTCVWLIRIDAWQVEEEEELWFLCIQNHVHDFLFWFTFERPPSVITNLCIVDRRALWLIFVLIICCIIGRRGDFDNYIWFNVIENYIRWQNILKGILTKDFYVISGLFLIVFALITLLEDFEKCTKHVNWHHLSIFFDVQWNYAFNWAREVMKNMKNGT